MGDAPENVKFISLCTKLPLSDQSLQTISLPFNIILKKGRGCFRIVLCENDTLF